jgi:uncharacterized damage-inducible protein DinB
LDFFATSFLKAEVNRAEVNLSEYTALVNQDLIDLFQRDLKKLIAELEAYPDEAGLWTKAGEIKNSAGNLALHLIGNLNQFIGVDLGGTDFKRDREAEFNSSGMARAEIIKQLEATITTIETVVGSLTNAQLEAKFPKEVLGHAMTTQGFLLHLYGHLNYHLGQVNYHRRLLHV